MLLLFESYIHVGKRIQSGGGTGPIITVHNEKHGGKTQEGKNRGVREKHFIAYMLKKSAGQDRSNDLRTHGGRVVVSGKTAGIGAAAHFDHHRQGIDVDQGPGGTDNEEVDIHCGIESTVAGSCNEESGDKAGTEAESTDEDRFLAADLRCQDTGGNKG